MKGDEEGEAATRAGAEKGTASRPGEKGTGTIDWDRSCESLYLVTVITGSD